MEADHVDVAYDVTTRHDREFDGETCVDFDVLGVDQGRNGYGLRLRVEKVRLLHGLDLLVRLDHHLGEDMMAMVLGLRKEAAVRLLPRGP